MARPLYQGLHLESEMTSEFCFELGAESLPLQRTPDSNHVQYHSRQLSCVSLKFSIMAAINAVAIAETGPIAGSPRDSPQSPLPTLPAPVAEAFTSQIRQQA